MKWSDKMGFSHIYIYQDILWIPVRILFYTFLHVLFDIYIFVCSVDIYNHKLQYDMNRKEVKVGQEEKEEQEEQEVLKEEKQLESIRIFCYSKKYLVYIV